jgi:ubiquitin carboxyl-terminal hydrolase 36/42
MYSRGAQPLSPKLFADNLKVFSKAIQLGRQEDAHEFLRCLLDNLTLHLGQVPSVVMKAGSKRTLVQHWLLGKLQSTVKCMGCRHLAGRGLRRRPHVAQELNILRRQP